MKKEIKEITKKMVNMKDKQRRNNIHIIGVRGEGKCNGTELIFKPKLRKQIK